MRRIIFSLLLIYSSSVLANIRDDVLATRQIGVNLFEINPLFEQYSVGLVEIPNIFDQLEKIGRCMDEYVKKQTKSYAKIAQNNLYDLIHNFNRIILKVYGKKLETDDIPYEEKVEALAKVQCEAYYMLGVLK